MVDGCTHSFEELVTSIIPALIEQLTRAMTHPYRLEDLVQGKTKALQLIGKPSDIPGCYILIENGTPFYVGISRNIRNRLTQHCCGRGPNDGSLPYRLARDKTQHTMTRGAAMANSDFCACFEDAKRRIRSMHVVFIEVNNPVTLHLLEVAASMHFKTGAQNTFRTH